MATEKMSLSVDGEHPAVRIDVLDDRYRTVESGFGQMDTDLPRGLYTVRFSAGDSVIDKGVTLYPGFAPDKPVTPQKPLLFSAAAPLEGTSTTREYHREHAERLSHSISKSLGSGSQLLVFVRDLDRRGHTSPVTGLHLLDAEGTPLVDIGEIAETQTVDNEDHWAGVNLELAPGAYILRLDREDVRAVEMPLYTFPHWQTQFFAIRTTQSTGEAIRRPDLTSANILIGPYGFHSSTNEVHSLDDALERDARLAELAREALEGSRELASRKDLNEMLMGKWHDPMTGLLAGHIVARREDPNTDLLRTVIGNLTDLLRDPDQADLLALRIRLAQCLGEPLPEATITFPPMLRQSWKVLVEASGVSGGLIPTGSLAARIAGRLWGKSAWMLWMAPDPRKERTSEQVQESVVDAVSKFALPTATEVLIGPLALEHTLSLRDFALPEIRRFGVPKSVESLTKAFARLNRGAVNAASEGQSAPRASADREAEAAAPAPETNRDTVQVLTRVEDLLKAFGDDLDVDAIAEEMDLSGTEFQLLTHVTDRIAEAERLERRTTTTSTRRTPPSLPPASEAYALPALIATFRLPASVLSPLTAGLLVKLTAWQEDEDDNEEEDDEHRA